MPRRRDEDDDDKDRPRAPRPKGGPRIGGKHARIRFLDCFEEVQERLSRHTPIPEIARWLQEDKLECTDIGRESLVTSLHRYKADMGPIPRLDSVMPSAVQKAEEQLKKGLDELEELEKIFMLQMGRVEMGMGFEKSTRILNRFLNQEVALAAQILQKRHNIKMDLGYEGGRELGTLNIRPELVDDLRERHGEGAADALASAEARGRALSIARSISLLEGDFEEILDDEFEETVVEATREEDE